MITNRHSLQSPVGVPCYNCTRENHRLFNVMRVLKQFPPDLNLRDSQTVSDDGDSVH
ncbi:hypothetical protein ABIB82_007842 [Bradyrhizobium sp. i1.8.4]